MLGQIKKLTVSAVLAALGVVIMYFGSLVEVMDLTTVFVASFLVVLAILELGSPWYWLLWAVTSVLSFLLLPNKFCSFEYALFGGFYPIAKYLLEKLPRNLAYLLKFAVFNLLFAGLLFLSVRLFGLEEITLPFLGKLTPGLYFSVMAILGNLLFILYDILLTKLILIYNRRFRERVKRILK